MLDAWIVIFLKNKRRQMFSGLLKMLFSEFYSVWVLNRTKGWNKYFSGFWLPLKLFIRVVWILMIFTFSTVYKIIFKRNLMNKNLHKRWQKTYGSLWFFFIISFLWLILFRSKRCKRTGKIAISKHGGVIIKIFLCFFLQLPPCKKSQVK